MPIFEHVLLRGWGVAFLPKSLSCLYPVLTAVIFISCLGLTVHGLILLVVIIITNMMIIVIIDVAVKCQLERNP